MKTYTDHELYLWVADIDLEDPAIEKLSEEEYETLKKLLDDLENEEIDSSIVMTPDARKVVLHLMTIMAVI